MRREEVEEINMITTSIQDLSDEQRRIIRQHQDDDSFDSMALELGVTVEEAKRLMLDYLIG